MDARLWQDPFEAAQQAVERNPAAHTAHELRDQIARRYQQAKSFPLILPVMVTANRYAESIETRLRTRYAVVAALNAAGYKPVDSEHIGCVRLELRARPDDKTLWEAPRWMSDQLRKLLELSGRLSEPAVHTRVARGTPPGQMSVPFEWFEPKPGHGSQVHHSLLVLWLPDEQFARTNQPLRWITRMLSDLGAWPDRPKITTEPGESTEEDESEKAALAHRAHVRLIGPATTTTLRVMIEEIADAKRAADGDTSGSDSQKNALAAMRGLRIYSSRSSAAPSSLLNDDVCQALGVPLTTPSREAYADQWAKLEKDWWKRSGVVLNRTIHTDDLLMLELVHELGRRLPAAPKPHVVLVGESDTFYSRAMPPAFRQAAEALHFTDPDRITSFSYLRGLDGQLPGLSEQNKSEEEGGKKQVSTQA